MIDRLYNLVFDGRAGDPNDVTVHRAIAAAGGCVTDCATFVAFDPPKRGIKFSVPVDRAEILVKVLRRFGFEPKSADTVH